MGEMIIKLGDEKLIERISDLARAHRRSPEREAEDILRRVVLNTTSRTERAKTAAGIAAMTPRNRTQTDSALLIREDRDR